MGLITATAESYYGDSDNYGNYQFISLADIVNNFMLMYQGDHELVNNISRYQVLFHAKRAIQELNYDAFKEVKVLQLDVSDGLRFVLPPDYVNWIRISYFQDDLSSIEEQAASKDPLGQLLKMA